MPLNIVDNRPEYIRREGGNPSIPTSGQHQGRPGEAEAEGDVLFVQPPHLTTGRASSSSTTRGQPLQPDIADLETQAEKDIRRGRAPRWEIEDVSSSMRSSIPVGDVSFDISWYHGAGPPTLPPTIPIAPNVVFTARGTATGVWRGILWTPLQGEIIRHPPRLRHEPSLVAYKTMSTAWRMGPTLSPGVVLSLRPVGEWIAVTRFELSFARTPRFWHVVVEATVDPDEGELPLQDGEQFFLEWQGVKREWVRRPRFEGDIARLGGYSFIPPTPQPEPPIPPERTLPASAGPRRQRPATSSAPPATSASSTSSSTLRGGPPPETREARQGGNSSSTPSSTPTQPQRLQEQRQHQQREEANTGRSQQREGSEIPKAKPPLPPQPDGTSGSESETSWLSEDPDPEPGEPREEDLQDASTPTSSTTTTSAMMETDGNMALTSDNLDSISLMQNLKPPGETGPGAHPPERRMESTAGTTRDNNAWIPEEAPRTPWEVLQALTKVVHELLQASFSQPSEDVTTLAYRACGYLTQLQTAHQPEQSGDNPDTAPANTTTFAFDNPLIEAEATLHNMVQNHGELPRRHLYCEIARVEQLLKDAKQVFATWTSHPDAAGAHEGMAGIRNALDAMDWAHLAVEEGNIAQIGETLLIATEAAQRSKGYMDTLMSWLRTKFENLTGSPVKRQRLSERASGSQQAPVYDNPRPAHPPQEQADEPAPLRRRPRETPLHDHGQPEGYLPHQDLRPERAQPQ